MTTETDKIARTDNDAPLFSKLQLRNLIIPLIIEQTLALSVGMFDTIMVAGAGESAVSGVSLVENINVLLINLFAALATGGAIVAGQYLGRQEKSKGNYAAKQLLMVTFFISVLIMIICLLLNAPILRIFGQVEAQVWSSARTYFYITALSYPCIAVYNASAALFRCMGNTKTAMVNSLIMNVLNIGGNAVFIFGMGLGVFGAALATVISRLVAAAVMVLMLRNPSLDIHVRSYSPRDLDLTMIKRILQIGIPNGLENSIFQIGKIIVTSLVAAFGTTSIAAHAVANSLTAVQVIPGMALGMAIMTVVAQCAGAGRFDQATMYTKYLMKRTYLYMVLLNGAILLLLYPVLSLYQLSEETFHLARNMLLIHGIGSMFIWPMSFTLPNAFRAAGDVKSPMMVSIFSMWVFRVGLSYVFSHILGLGAIGIWFAMIVDWVFRSTCFLLHWRSGRWWNKLVI